MIPEWVDRFTSIPFKDSDEPLRSGTSCWGLVRLVYRELLNIEIPSLSAQYSGAFDIKAIHRIVQEQMETNWPEVQRDSVKALDLIVLRFKGTNSHIGIVLDKRFFLHLHEGEWSHQDNYVQKGWSKQVVGFHRYFDRERLGF